MAYVDRLLTNLIPFKRYSVRVRAVSNLGVKSQWSEALDFTTPGDTSVPGPPTNLVVGFDTPDLFLAWDPPALNTNGSILEDLYKYEITLTDGADSNVYEVSTSLLNPRFVLSYNQNRSDFTTARGSFNVEIRAVDVTGQKSDPLTGVAQNPVPLQPEDPDILVFTTTVTVTMVPNAADPDIQKYRLERATQSDFSDTAEIYYGTGNTYFDNTDTVATYYYRYRTEDIFTQLSPYSEYATVTTEAIEEVDTTPPPPVEDVTIAENALDESYTPYFLIEWTPDNVTDDLAYYEVRVQNDDVPADIRSIIVGPNSSSLIVRNLNYDTPYTVALYSYDFNGNVSGISNTDNATTLTDDSAPTTPENFSTRSGIRTIFVLWDTVDSPRLSHYELYGETVSGFVPDNEDQATPPATPNQNLLFSGNANRFVLETQDDETWYFRLRAVNTNGVASDFTAEFSGTSTYGYQAVDAATPNGNYFQIDPFGNIWIGDEDFADAPFRVNNQGAGQFRNVVITGDLMDPGDLIIDTNAFDVTNDGDVTASNITATGGQIGNITIETDKLTGGTIEGSEFRIQNSGSVVFDGSGNITWEAGATGGIEVSDSGYIENTTWDGYGGDFGWRIDDTGIYLNEGTLDASSIQIGISSINLLKNSSFENDSDDYATPNGPGMADWWESDAAATFTIADIPSLYQEYSQQIDVTSSETIEFYQDFTKPGGDDFATDETLVFSYWIRQDAGTARTVRAVCTDTADSVLFAGVSSQVTLTLGGGWTRVISIFRLPSVQTTLRFKMVILSAENGDQFFIDGAQAQLSDYATDYAPTPLEIPNNYIQSAWIANLTADRIKAGTIGAELINLGGIGSIIQSVNYDEGTLVGWKFEGDGTAQFYNGAIQMYAGGDGGVGYTVLDGASIRLIAGDGTDNSANTKFKVNHDGVFIGGDDENTAQVYFDTTEGNTVFQSADSGYTFTIDTAAPDGKVLRLTDGAATPTETFYLTDEGQAFFLGGVIGIGDTGSGSAFQVNEFGDIWLGGTTFANAVFSVSRTGDLTATSGTFKGSIVGGTIDIGSEPGSDPDANPLTGFHVNAEGQMFVGHTSYGSAPFSVDKDGSLYAIDGQIGDVTIESDKLSGGTIEGSTIIGGVFKTDDADTVPGRRLLLENDIRIFGPSATDFNDDYWRIYTTDQDNLLIEEGSGFPSAPDRGAAFRTLDSQTVRFQAYYGALEPTTLFLRIGDYGSGSQEDWSIGSSNGQAGSDTNKGFMTYIDNDQCFAFTTSPSGGGDLLNLKFNAADMGEITIQEGGSINFSPTPTTKPTDVAVHDQVIHYRPDGTQSVDVVISFEEPYNGQFYEIRIARAD